MIKKSIVWIAVMVILSASLMIIIDMERAPSVDGIVAELLENPEYAEMAEKELFAPYTELYDAGVKEVRIFTSTDGSAKEIAVCELRRHESDYLAIEVLGKRKDDLIKEFEGNKEELTRISDSRIIAFNNFVVLTICDSADTADEIVHRYIKKSKAIVSY